MRGVFSHAPMPSESTKNTYKVGHSIKLQKAKDIIAANITQSLFELIYPLAELPEDYFAIIYKQLIDQFASYVNILPRKLDAGLGSLYCGSVYGAYHTLKQFVDDKPEADCLWRFAVFSAALLKQCNVPAKQYQVIITDSEGRFRQRWNPFYNTFEEIDAQYCKLYDYSNLYVHNHAILMGLALSKTMPQECLQWLASNGDLFSQWLDCLQSEYDTAGILGEALEPLKDEEEISLWEEKLAVELVETPETAPGEILDQWIREAIKDGSIKINTPDAPLQIIRDGLSDAMFVEQGIIKNFAAKLATSPISAAAAAAQFHALFGPSQQHALAMAMPGLTRRNSLMSSGAASSNHTQVHKGVLLDPASYFGKEQTPAKSEFANQNSAKKGAESMKALNKIIEAKGTGSEKDQNNYRQRAF